MTRESKRVPGYSGFVADTTGRVFNRFGRETGHQVKTGKNAGYYMVCIKRGKYVGRHRLVCLAFHGEPPTPEHFALHSNDVKGDDRPENLYWGTRLENMADSIRNGKRVIGEKCGRARLTEVDVIAIRKAALGPGLTQSHAKLARTYGVSEPTIRDVVIGRTWKHI